MNIWFSADSHYFHKNIAGPKVSVWKGGYRNFEDEKEMSRHIVKVWNQTVKEDDILYHLGDWSFGGINNIWNFRKQLRCKTIHLILGNHDHHIEANKQINIGVDDKNRLLKLEIYDDPYKRWEHVSHINTRDLFTTVNQVLTVKYGQHTFFLSHYSHRIWLGSHKGIIHLYGHSHGSISDFGKSMDVGIDSAKKIVGEYRPFSVEEIISIMDTKEIEFPDHHNPDTNMK